MHLLTEKTVHIHQNTLDVFAYVSNLENFEEWFPGVISIESSNALEHGHIGKQYRETVLIPLRGTRQITLEVREVREGHFLATESRFPPLMPRMEMELRETGEGSCELTWRMFSRTNNGILKYTLIPLAKRIIRRRAVLGVAALKVRMENR